MTIYIQGESVDTGTPTNNDFTYDQGELVNDGGGSNFAFIQGRGINGSENKIVLTVFEENGTEVGSVNIEWENFEPNNYVSWSHFGSDLGDGEYNLQDNLRGGNGNIYESFENGDLNDYSVTTEDGTSGDFSITTQEKTEGNYALRGDTGQSRIKITSDEQISPLQDTNVYKYDVNHPVDKISDFAMKTVAQIGTNSSGITDNAITTEFVNPGSKRTEGAKLKVNDSIKEIVFTPNLGEWYTFKVEVL